MKRKKYLQVHKNKSPKKLNPSNYLLKIKSLSTKLSESMIKSISLVQDFASMIHNSLGFCESILVKSEKATN